MRAVDSEIGGVRLGAAACAPVSAAGAAGLLVGVLDGSGADVSVGVGGGGGVGVGVRLNFGACDPGAGLAGVACSSLCTRAVSSSNCVVRVCI